MTEWHRFALDRLNRDSNKAAMSLNQRLFVEKIMARGEREPDAGLTPAEANYLRSIAAKFDMTIEEDSHAENIRQDRADVEPQESGDGPSPAGGQGQGAETVRAARAATGGEAPREDESDSDEIESQANASVDATPERTREAGVEEGVSRLSGGRTPDATSERTGVTAGRDRQPSKPLEFHPLANLFPLIEGGEFDELVEDIRVNGVREVITLLDGKILDGRNRYRAMQALLDSAAMLGEGWGSDAGKRMRTEQLVPARTLWPFEDFDEERGGEPLTFVLSKNLHRRHLTDDQRRMVAARIANLGKGRPEGKAANGGINRKQAAEMLTVDHAGVERARTVVTKGTEELQHAVEIGHTTVRAAAEIARLDPDAQRRIIAEVAKHPDSRKAFKSVVSEVRREGQDEKKERRAERERELATRQRALPDKRYGVILVDDEWDFEVFSRDTGMDRHAANQYPVSENAHTPEEIHARTAERFTIAAPDCVLLQWVPVPHLAIGIRLMELRGFCYVTNFNWGKDRIGTGYWNRNKHEHLLVGVRGSVPAPAMGDQWNSDLPAPVRAHSVKPDWQYELIEAYFPNLPKIELNARRARPGWDAWGLEAPEPDHDPETGEITEAAE